MPGPSSIRSSSTQQTTFDNSAFGPSITITRKDLAASTLAYQRLLSASKAYTSDILSLSSSSSELASALDECSRLKGSHESSSQLQALSGLYYLVSSYNQVLADSFWKDFSIPLLNHFDLYNATNIDRSITNEKLLSEKSRVLKEMEMKNLKNGRKKERDLNSFRKALNELQQQVEEIDRIKSDYYHELLQSEEECWKLVMEKVSRVRWQRCWVLLFRGSRWAGRLAPSQSPDLCHQDHESIQILLNPRVLKEVAHAFVSLSALCWCTSTFAADVVML